MKWPDKVLIGVWAILFTMIVGGSVAEYLQREAQAQKLLKRTYHPLAIADMAREDPHKWSRMHTHVEVTGVVTYLKLEDDGDMHIRLCDTTNAVLLHTMDRAHCVVAEAIPTMHDVQPVVDHVKLGQQIVVRGIARFDAEGGCTATHLSHCWWEIHPIETLQILPPAASKPAGPEGAEDGR